MCPDFYFSIENKKSGRTEFILTYNPVQTCFFFIENEKSGHVQIFIFQLKVKNFICHDVICHQVVCHDFISHDVITILLVEVNEAIISLID